MQLPSVVIVPHKTLRAACVHPEPERRALAMPLDEALAAHWGSDAYVTAYAPTDPVVRLASAAIGNVPVVMTMLIGDVDDPTAHASGKPASPEWRAGVVPGLVSSGLAYYATKGGYRILATLETPYEVRSREAWWAIYLAWVDELSTTYGLVLDPSCKDWTRLFRLPNVERVNAGPQRALVEGTLRAVPLPRPVTPGVAMARAMAPSIAGQGGDEALFKAACNLARLAQGDVADTLALLVEFNLRCVPPWDAAKLSREATKACARATSPEEAYGARLALRAPAVATTLELGRDGRPRATHANAEIVLAEAYAGLRLDVMRGRIVNSGEIWVDAHTTRFRMLCEARGLTLTRAMADEAIVHYALERPLNAWLDWLVEAAGEWDGVARVDQALSTYWGAPDTDATRASSRVWLLSMAARGLEPGCKVDTCPVFIGAQGAGKSSALRALVGNDWFADSDLPIGNKEALQNIRGKVLWEFPEHASVTRKDRDAAKAFLSQSIDSFRAPYGHHTEDIPRTCTFASSTNEREVLNDPTGARRYLPVHIGRIDMAGILRDRKMLFGEAASRIAGGEAHWPSAAEELTLWEVREEATEVDPWEELLLEWLPSQKGKSFRLSSVFDDTRGGPIAIPPERRSGRNSSRVGGILRKLGWEPWRTCKGGRLWSKNAAAVLGTNARATNAV